MAKSSVHYHQDMERLVAGQIFNGRAMSGPPTKAMFSFDRLSMNAAATPSEEFARKLKEKYPALEIGNIAPLVYHLRAIKTKNGIYDCRRIIISNQLLCHCCCLGQTVFLHRHVNIIVGMAVVGRKMSLRHTQEKILMLSINFHAVFSWHG
jgi:hypothetical protein